MVEVLKCGVGDNPMEGQESLCDVSVCWHPNFELVLARRRCVRVEAVRNLSSSLLEHKCKVRHVRK